MQVERHDSHRAEKIDWCPSPNKGLPIQPRKYFPVMVFDGWPIFNQITSRARFKEIVRVMRFNEARPATRSPDKLQPIRTVSAM